MYDIDEYLAPCHELKEEFRLFFEEIKIQESASAFLDYWTVRVEETGIPELIAFGRTLSNWREEILNYWNYSISNGFVEAQNHKIQNIKRRAYGYRNNENFDRRVLLECG
jgi:transposase